MREIAKLRDEMPTLKNSKGEHYADILERLIIERLSASPVKGEDPSPLPAVIDKHAQPSKIAPGPRINKAALPIGEPRRFRDKAHLRTVAAMPCLICGRAPSHAHHLKFAQRHGLAQKVSDEFTVPLCAVHHDELHRSSAEPGWWREKEAQIRCRSRWSCGENREEPLPASGGNGASSPLVTLPG